MKNCKYPVLLAGIIGNAIETYDLSIYPFFSVYLAKAFFPNQSTYVSLLNVFGIFLFGYLSRPIGALIFGRIGDFHGRKKTLISSSLLMMVATGMIGILPTYQSIGYVGLDVGDMDGTLAVQITNEYLLAFFDKYLKNKPSPIFDTCTPKQNTLLQCGPGKTPEHN